MKDTIFDEFAAIEEEMFALLDRFRSRADPSVSRRANVQLQQEKREESKSMMHQSTNQSINQSTNQKQNMNPEKEIAKTPRTLTHSNRQQDLTVFETESKVIVSLPVQGTIQKIDLQVKDNMLFLMLQIGDKKEESNDKVHSFRSSFQTVQRAVTLPVPVLREYSQAFHERGVLHIELQKKNVRKENLSEDDYEN